MQAGAVHGKAKMHIRYGFDIEMQFSQPTTLITVLDVHPSRRGDIVREQDLSALSNHPTQAHIDSFGNLCRRIHIEDGLLHLRCDGIIRDSGEPDKAVQRAKIMPIMALPKETLIYLHGSRYCETDLLADFAWKQFGEITDGWQRVQAVTDFVHSHLSFGYEHASATRSALQAFEQRIGVCRDFAHLAVALCRCLNIPARYCNGYLGDIGVPVDPAGMDFSAWFQAYLGGEWYSFDPRHNQRRIGRILIGCGRDAADVPMISSFGRHSLSKFEVVTELVPEELAVASA